MVARKEGELLAGEYVRCWMCNGNGLEPIYPYSNVILAWAIVNRKGASDNEN